MADDYNLADLALKDKIRQVLQPKEEEDQRK
jgi:hypothetical protein